MIAAPLHGGIGDDRDPANQWACCARTDQRKMVGVLAQALPEHVMEATDQKTLAGSLLPIHAFQGQLLAVSVVDGHHGATIEQRGGAHQTVHEIWLLSFTEGQNLVPCRPIREWAFVVPNQHLQQFQLFLLLTYQLLLGVLMTAQPLQAGDQYKEQRARPKLPHPEKAAVPSDRAFLL
ncbi:hypothetical protein [Cyanobium sp. A2C-AMD]|uniref:hypothetical protein n=1 Tax=Cyanobium sp. A2C-AMD TaxID=2823695 RepID=UPI0020CBCF68|nr:hypothetical protein [Cyanobium sp. A2C-AMD]MCP9875799.1 hypothetical protein [Cyanobium sp. A2C-AMD]